MGSRSVRGLFEDWTKFAHLRNPKDKRLLTAWATRRSRRGARDVFNVHLYLRTRDSHGRRVLAGSALLEALRGFKRDFPLRIHAQSGYLFYGRGYGAVLYMASALFADHVGREGICSPPWNRSLDASKMWEKLVALGVATMFGGWNKMTGDAVRDTGLVTWELGE